MIARSFGTFRGLVRLALSFAEVWGGRAGINAPDNASVRRLVFVCHGNICRSAFAHQLAAAQGLRVASFGLSTSSGKPAHGPAIASAAVLGHDLASHRSLALEDYVPEPGDLLLAMETRQLRRIAGVPRLAHLPRGLLGLYAQPRFPHLHDPYQLSESYMTACLRRIETAIPVLARTFPNARAG